MLKNTLFVILLMISSLFTACAEGYVVMCRRRMTQRNTFQSEYGGRANDVLYQGFCVFGRNEMEDILF